MGLRSASRAFSSTESTIASTCRSLLPVATTKTSVIASRSLTSIRTMSVASLSAAACAAMRASEIASSVAVIVVSSLLTVEVVFVDVLDDAVRDEVPDRPPGSHPLATAAGRDGHRRHVEQRHRVDGQVLGGQVVAGTRDPDEAGQLQRL